MSLSSDGNTIASAHLDQHVRLWSLRSGELIENLEKVHSKLVSCVEFSRAGNLLVSCGRDSILKVFDTRTYRVLHELCDPEFTNPQNWSKFGFSSDGRYVVTGSGNGKVIIWDVEKGRRKRILTHHKEAVMSCQWSPSGKHILSGDKSGDLILWHESPDGKGSKH